MLKMGIICKGYVRARAIAYIICINYMKTNLFEKENSIISSTPLPTESTPITPNIMYITVTIKLL